LTEKTALPQKDFLLDSSLPRANPGHIGIIMDGNGRWARQRGQLRTQGHLEGLKAAKRVVRAASEAGVSYLTLYTFSTENWKRPVEEVGFIMGLAKQHLRAELDFYRENRIRIRHAGDRNGLPKEVLFELDEACRDTRDFKGLQVILALNYGGRDEIIRAFKKLIMVEAHSGTGIDENTVNMEKMSLYLDNPDVPDPDLIIRTAGEFRTSNFLLWESAYSEYFISDKFWPDWTEVDFLEAIRGYRGRDRRVGAVRGSAK
jgi:undecaprenyl diphosphate synthase